MRLTHHERDEVEMKVIEPVVPTPCRLPEADRYRDGTLAQCEDCGRWWVKWTDYTYWAAPAWRQVRWWNFAARRRIREAGS